MPKPIKFSYEKKPPFRDASLFLIICEGQEREKKYFGFFEGLSSRVKIVPASNDDGASAPEKLIDLALEKETAETVQPDIDQVWFLIDTDRWRKQLHVIRQKATERKHWHIAQSNPCFEVWLYFHAKSQLPELERMHECKSWKPLLPAVIKGGFDSDRHPVAIETALINAKAGYQGEGYFPTPGSSQIWQLAERLLPLIQKDLEVLKARIPAPEALE